MTSTTLKPALAAPPPSSAALWERHGEAITTMLCAVFVGAGWMAHRAGVGVVGTSLIFLVGYVLGGYRQAIEGTTTLWKERELESLSEHPLARAIVKEAAPEEFGGRACRQPPVGAGHGRERNRRRSTVVDRQGVPLC